MNECASNTCPTPKAVIRASGLCYPCYDKARRSGLPYKTERLPAKPLRAAIKRAQVDPRRMVTAVTGEAISPALPSLSVNADDTVNLYVADEYCVTVLGIHPSEVYGAEFFSMHSAFYADADIEHDKAA